MSVNTETTQDIMAAARAFAEGIAENADYMEYEAASEAFRGDQEARKLLNRFQTAQNNAQRRSMWGGGNGDEEDLEQLRTEVMDNPVLARYFASQEGLVTTLKEIDQYMTEKLGFDFAELTKPAGGCC